jgi:hypothetical protein
VLASAGQLLLDMGVTGRFIFNLIALTNAKCFCRWHLVIAF